MFGHGPLQDATNAVAPLSRLLRRFACQVIAADAGVGVDDAEWRRLELQVLDRQASTTCFMTSAKLPA